MPAKVNLPFELISHVILLSSDDSASLLSLSLVSHLFHHEAARHLYAVSPPVKLGISLTGSPPMQFLQVIKRSTYHAGLVRHFVLSIVAYDEKIIDLVRALERMVNLETLEIRHIYIQAAHGLMDLTPTLFDNPKCKFRLKALLWTSNRQQIALLRLGDLIALHRDTLEILRVNFQSEARDMNHDTNIRIMNAIQCRTADESTDTNSQSQSVSTTRSVWPLPRLRALLGSQETLDIFFPLVEQSNQIVKLEIITPAGSQFYAKGSPDPKDTFPRLIESVKLNPIRALHIDFVRNMPLKLQDLTPYLPFVETLKLNQPSLQVCVSIRMFRRPNRCPRKQTLSEALAPLKNLRALLMTFREGTVVSQVTVGSVFASCHLLDQVEIGIVQDSEGNLLYTRWWPHRRSGSGARRLDMESTTTTLLRAGGFTGPSQYFLHRFA